MPVSASEIRELLRLIRGVEAVEVRVAPDGSIDSVEVRIAESRSTARVIRDIESALMSGLGLRIDHKAIHVANGAGNGSAAHAAPVLSVTTAKKVWLPTVRLVNDAEYGAALSVTAKFPSTWKATLLTVTGAPTLTVTVAVNGWSATPLAGVVKSAVNGFATIVIMFVGESACCEGRELSAT